MYDPTMFEEYTAFEHGLQMNRIPLRIIRRVHNNAAPAPLHSHNFWEIVVVRSGSCRHVVHLPDGEEIVYPFYTGHVGMIAPGEKHAFTFETDDESIEILNILFSALVIQRGDSSNWDDMPAFDFIHLYPYLPAVQRQKLQIVLSQGKLDEIYRLIENIETEQKGKRLGYNTMSQLYFTMALTIFMREFYSLAGSVSTLTGDALPAASKCVPLITKFVGQNAHRAITLEELSRHTHFSIRHMTRKFKSVMGVSITEYIQTQRIENAKVLLQSTDRKVEDIALGNGFGNVSHFCQQFKKRTGCTPQQFRRLQFHDDG